MANVACVEPSATQATRISALLLGRYGELRTIWLLIRAKAVHLHGVQLKTVTEEGTDQFLLAGDGSILLERNEAHSQTGEDQERHDAVAARPACQGNRVGGGSLGRFGGRREGARPQVHLRLELSLGPKSCSLVSDLLLTRRSSYAALAWTVASTRSGILVSAAVTTFMRDQS